MEIFLLAQQADASPIRIVIIAAGMFLVTMALFTGFLAACRVFVRPDQEESRQQGSRVIWPGLLAGGCGLLALLGLFVTARQAPTPAIVDVYAPVPPGAMRMMELPPESPRPSFADPVVTRHDSARLSWFGILLPLVLVVGVAVLVNALARRIRLGRPGWAMLAVTCCGLAVAVLLGGFWMTLRQSDAQREYRQVIMEHHSPQAVSGDVILPLEPVAHVADEADVSASAAAESTEEDETAQTEPLFVEYVSHVANGTPLDAAPAWLKEPDLPGPLKVLSSGPHATFELAQADLLDQLAKELTQDFVRRHPEARGWSPSASDVLHSGSILNRALERTSVTVGDFTSPMYEIHWQVDTSIHDKLLVAWRPTEVRSRLQNLGGGVGLLTLLFGVAATVLRFRTPSVEST